MSRLSSRSRSALVSFLTNVTAFLTKQFSRLNYTRHTSDKRVRPTRRKKFTYSLIAVLRTKLDNIFQFTSNEFFAHVSKRRKHVRFAFLGYPISSRHSIPRRIRYVNRRFRYCITYFCIYVYRKCCYIFFFSLKWREQFYTNVLKNCR